VIRQADILRHNNRPLLCVICSYCNKLIKKGAIVRFDQHVAAADWCFITYIIEALYQTC